MGCETGREMSVEIAVQLADLRVAVQEDELNPDLVRFLNDRLGGSGGRWKIGNGEWWRVERW